jgi:hypothetical protein
MNWDIKVSSKVKEARIIFEYFDQTNLMDWKPFMWHVAHKKMVSEAYTWAKISRIESLLT